MSDSANSFSAQGMRTVAIASPDDDLQATFVPAAGMVCASLRFHGDELLAQRRGVRAYAERGSTMGIPLLHPWANRLSGFRYDTPGAAVELDPHSALTPHDPNGLPIHGVVPGLLDWQLLDDQGRQPADRLRAQMSWARSDLLAVFPFPHTLQLDARLSGSALTVETTLRTTSDVAVPVSFGYHPYLTIPGSAREDWTVELPAASRLLLDEQMIPTGAAEAVAARSFTLGGQGWDDGFAELPATPRFSVAAQSRTIELEFLHGYGFAQVFTQPGAGFVCLEPMTAPANALVSGRGLTFVSPGEEFRAAFSVSLSGWR